MKRFRFLSKLVLASLLLTTGCTIVTYDRVFPKLTWVWSSEARQQRADQELSKHLDLATNSPAR